MFDELTEKIDGVFKRLRGQGKLTEKNIRDSLKDVRRVFLEADVNYKVARDFIKAVEGKALGADVLSSVTPGQLIVKIVYDEMVNLLGSKAEPLRLEGSPPAVAMLIGLQGSGKTTLAGKLALMYRKRKRRVLLVAADVYRPAAVAQLVTLGKSIDVPVFAGQDGAGDEDPVAICAGALEQAAGDLVDIVILDTAGRLQIDDRLMEELQRIKQAVGPAETLLVADAMTGQEAVNVAVEFDRRVGIDGVVLTKMDGDARGGAALSIKATVGKPIKLVGVGEKLDALEVFHPDRMASRILGMGDIVTLVEKAQATYDQKQVEKLEKKLRKQEFTFEDFFEQLQQMKKMGPLESLLEMIPGFGGKALKGIQVDDRAMGRIEAIINSMTVEERRHPQIINGSRRKRIAAGSGTSVQDVNALLKQFANMRKMMKNMSKMKFKGVPRGLMPGM